MSLENIRRITTLGGHEVVHMDDLREVNPSLFPPELKGQMDYEAFERDIRPNKFIYLRHDKNSISFTLEKDGQDGCPVNCLAGAALAIISEKNKKNPCEEYRQAIDYLTLAMQNLIAHAVRQKKRQDAQD